MKLINILKLLTVAFVIVNCGAKPLEEGHYRINGTVKGLDDGEVYLMAAYPKFDTIKVEKGAFSIEKELKDIVGHMVLVKTQNMRGVDQKNYISLFIEPTIMNLDLNYEDFSRSKLTGSSTQDDQYRLDETINKITENYRAELDHFDAIREKSNNAAQAGASEDVLEAIKLEDNDARNKLEPMRKEQNEATLQFIKENPKSYVSLQSLRFQLNDMKYSEAKALSDQLNPEHLKTQIGKEIIKSIENMHKGIPGAKASNFETTDINGNSLKLADFKGKYLLIDFWASWCVPCRKGNPHLISLYNKYHPKGLEILGVSDDDRAHDKWKKAIEKDGIGIWHHVLRGLEYEEDTHKQINIEKDISSSYNIHTLPTKILVDPDGVIIGRYGGGGEDDAAMDKKLSELFDE